jgi:hypothetical protein
MARTPIVALLLVASAAVPAGCGGDDTVDDARVEEGLEQQLSTSSAKVTSAACPADVEAEDGATFTCSLKFDTGASGKATVTQESRNEFTSALKPGSVKIPGTVAADAVEKSLAAQGAANATVECPDPVAVKVDTSVTCTVAGAGGAATGSVTYTFTDAYGTVDADSVAVEES